MLQTSLAAFFYFPAAGLLQPLGDAFICRKRLSSDVKLQLWLPSALTRTQILFFGG